MCCTTQFSKCFRHVSSNASICCDPATSYGCGTKCCKLDEKCAWDGAQTFHCCSSAHVFYKGTCLDPTATVTASAIAVYVILATLLVAFISVLIGKWKRQLISRSNMRVSDTELPPVRSSFLVVATTTSSMRASSAVLTETFDLESHCAKFSTSWHLRNAALRMAAYRLRWLALYHCAFVCGAAAFLTLDGVPLAIYGVALLLIVVRTVEVILCAFQVHMCLTTPLASVAVLATWGLEVVLLVYRYHITGWVNGVSFLLLAMTSFLVPRVSVEVDRSFESNSFRVHLWFFGLSKIKTLQCLMGPTEFKVSLDRLMERDPCLLAVNSSAISPRGPVPSRYAEGDLVRRNAHDSGVCFNFSPLCILQGTESVGRTVKVARVQKSEEGQEKYIIEGTEKACLVKLMELHFDNADARGMFGVGDIVKRNFVDATVLLNLGGTIGKIYSGQVFTVTSFFVDTEGGKYRIRGSPNFIRQAKFEKWFELNTQSTEDAVNSSTETELSEGPLPTPVELNTTYQNMPNNM